MLFTPIQTNNPHTKESLYSLICEIDEKILCSSIDQLNSIRYSTKTSVNLDDYENLSMYRDIIKEKMLGCNCLENYKIENIVSGVKRLLNKLNC